MAGRSHNVAAQATTLGQRFANAGEELLQATRRPHGLLDLYPVRYLDLDPADPPLGTLDDGTPCRVHGVDVMCGPTGLPPQRDIFLRGRPEGLRTDRKTVWKSDAYALIQAYGQVQARTAPRIYHVANRPVLTLDSALERVSAMLGVTLDWMEIRDFLPPHAEPALRRSALASSFVAALELAKMGRAELAQDEAFAPLRIRRLREGTTA